MGNCFFVYVCYFRQLLISLAFRKFQKDFDIRDNSGARCLSTKNWNSISYQVSSQCC